jgi:riboflavin transporter
MKYIILWFRIFFGAHLTFSSLRHYLTDWNAMVPDVGGRFVNSLVETGLYEIVKAVEGVVGLCLLLNIFVPLVLVIEFPISIVIFYLNFVIVGTGRQLFTGPQEVFLNGILILFYFGYYKDLLKLHGKPRPLGQEVAADV